MAIDLRTFIGSGANLRDNQQIWVQIVFFLHRGDGRFGELSSARMAFSGEIASVFFTGPFSLDVQIIDDRRAAVTLNGAAALDAMYDVMGDTLGICATFAGGRSGRITLRRVGDQTYVNVDVAGMPAVNVHFAPGEAR